MNTSRAELIEYSIRVSAAAMLSGLVGTGGAFGRSGERSHPNILLLMVDQ